MVQYCVCAGCTNTCLTGHRVHSFPRRKTNGASFRAWVRFVQTKRRDFSSASVTRNTVVCSAHFREEDYMPGDRMAFKMGYRSQNRVRLMTNAVPSIHATKCKPVAAAAPSPTSGGKCKQGIAGKSVRRKREQSTKSSKNQADRGLPVEKAAPPPAMSGNTNWDAARGMDGITVVRIDDSHIAEEQSHVGAKAGEGTTAYYDMEYAVPEEGGEEEEEGVYIIEYSNPEEEGQSYQFTMSVDRSLPMKKPLITHPPVRKSAKAPLPVTQVMSKLQRPQRPRIEPKRRRLMEEEVVKKEEILSNKCVLELGENYSDMMKNEGKSLRCLLCPPPGRLFKRGSGMAVHLKQMHFMEGKKTFYCMWCKQNVRSQIDLDAHTKRHVNQEAVFTCTLCASEAENKPEADRRSFKGSRRALQTHLQKEHPGIIPNCHVCHRSFKLISTYVADQFRHFGVTPYHCAKCQIYEITERGLSVHMKNHDRPRRKKQWPSENQPQTLAEPVVADNSATDDSDF